MKTIRVRNNFVHVHHGKVLPKHVKHGGRLSKIHHLAHTAMCRDHGSAKHGSGMKTLGMRQAMAMTTLSRLRPIKFNI